MFTLRSPAFANGQPIPDRHARDGGNLSPALEWSDPPPGTGSFVLIVEDPDAPAPAFRHWAVYDIPAERRALPEYGPDPGPHAISVGVNSFGNPYYDGPQPPPGDPAHTYRFRLIAVGVRTLGFTRQPSAGEIWDATRDNILSEAELTGTYVHR